MTNTGKDLQRLIRAIESARAAGQPIKIESPKRIRDKITGRLREHDVILTITHEHHELVVAIECRDRSRPIGVDAVEAFHSKCRDTGIHSGVMVSSKGFANTAITKAAAYNIQCLSLDQVDGFEWCEPTSMTLVQRKITHVTLNVDFPGLAKRDNPKLYDENNAVWEKERFIQIAKAAMDGAKNLPLAAGSHNVRFHQNAPAIYVVDGDNRIQAASCTLLVSFDATEEEVPLAFRAYSNAGTDSPITQAAVATVDVGNGQHVDFVMSTEADGRVAIHVVPNSTKPAE